jgi:hypothetical protein
VQLLQPSLGLQPLEQIEGQITVPVQEEPVLQSTEHPQELAQEIWPVQALLAHETVQSPRPQLIAPEHALSLQVTVQALPLEQSMGPWQPPLGQSTVQSQPGGQVQPVAQESSQTLFLQPLTQAVGQSPRSGWITVSGGGLVSSGGL